MGDWRDTNLAAVCADGALQTGPFGSQLHASDYRPEGVPVVMPQDLVGGKVSEQSIARVAEEDAERLSRHRLRKGDIVYSRRGDVTRNALITSRENGWLCGTGCLLVRPGPTTDSRWLAGWLSSPPTQEWIVRHAVGATMLNINTSLLGEVPVYLPPPTEQRRIASVLGAFDELIETIQGLVDAIAGQSAAAYRAAALDAPDASFGEVACLVRDGAVAGSMPSGTPYLALEHFGLDGSGIKARGIADTVVSSKTRFLAGDVLYGKLRPYFKKFDRPGFDGVCSTEIWVLRPQVGVGAGLLHQLVADPAFTEYAMLASGGTRMPRADWKHVSQMPVRIPAPPIRGVLERALDEYWRATVGLREELADLTRTRDELLPLLMSGRLRVEDVEGAI